MKIIELLKEMSQISDPIVPKFADPQENQKLYLKLSKTGTLSQDLGGGVKLYHNNGIGGKRNSFYAVHATNEPNSESIIYLMEYQREHDRLIGNYVMQRWIWVDPNYKTLIKGLPSKIFTQLINDFFTIVADSEQTHDGIRFWKTQLNNAFAHNLNVYFIDFENNIVKQVRRPSDIQKFDFTYGIWSRDESSLYKVFAISSKKLKTT